jgi:hypothetical protein
MTFSEARDDLINFLIACGIKLDLEEPTVIDGEAEKVTNGVARIGAKTGRLNGRYCGATNLRTSAVGARQSWRGIVRCRGKTGRANERGSRGQQGRI